MSPKNSDYFAMVFGSRGEYKSTGLKADIMRRATRGYTGHLEATDPNADLLSLRALAFQVLTPQSDTNTNIFFWRSFVNDTTMLEAASPVRAHDTGSYEPHSPLIKALIDSYDRTLAMSVRRKEPCIISSQEATDIVVAGLRERDLAYIALRSV